MMRPELVARIRGEEIHISHGAVMGPELIDPFAREGVDRPRFALVDESDKQLAGLAQSEPQRRSPNFEERAFE